MGNAALRGGCPSTGKVHTGAAEGPGPGAAFPHMLPRDPAEPLTGSPGTAPHAGVTSPQGRPPPRGGSGTGLPRRSRLPPHGCPFPPPWPPAPAPPPFHGPRPEPACPGPCPASRRHPGAPRRRLQARPRGSETARGRGGAAPGRAGTGSGSGSAAGRAGPALPAAPFRQPRRAPGLPPLSPAAARAAGPGAAAGLRVLGTRRLPRPARRPPARPRRGEG